MRRTDLPDLGVAMVQELDELVIRLARASCQLVYFAYFFEFGGHFVVRMKCPRACQGRNACRNIFLDDGALFSYRFFLS